ncbi:HNH/Endo VII superfamily nuclease toxin with a HHH motif [Flexilinea flocculi]|uniref:HNH/Endo VII superfamily nuclease toxin with a HHH motif n=2 Tax=Flexilinea flocculi TaxID=1678840 RepID=A0A0S7BTQ1_9CHLR|nr:HNH/Endo VII superfamily nuclease toxin with a HHH motif [Flexilinea flocculi]
MKIHAYTGISQQDLEAERLNSEGKPYSLNHPDDLLVSMRYNGDYHSSSNSQGWDRNSSYYFENLLHNHPEYFSKKNMIRINNNQSPKVDSQFVKNFPQYKGYENELLVHHHIGKDGQAVAIPASIHKGSGEIHRVENELGITANAQRFSKRCKEICEKDSSLLGNTSEQIITLEKRQLKDPPLANAITRIEDASSLRDQDNRLQTSNAIARLPNDLSIKEKSSRNDCQNAFRSDAHSNSSKTNHSR